MLLNFLNIDQSNCLQIYREQICERNQYLHNIFRYDLQCHEGSVVSMSTSHEEGLRFTPQLGHTKDHHKNGTDYLPAWQAGILVRVKQYSLTV